MDFLRIKNKNLIKCTVKYVKSNKITQTQKKNQINTNVTNSIL